MTVVHEAVGGIRCPAKETACYRAFFFITGGGHRQDLAQTFLFLERVDLVVCAVNTFLG